MQGERSPTTHEGPVEPTIRPGRMCKNVANAQKAPFPVCVCALQRFATQQQPLVRPHASGNSAQSNPLRTGLAASDVSPSCLETRRRIDQRTISTCADALSFFLRARAKAWFKMSERPSRECGWHPFQCGSCASRHRILNHAYKTNPIRLQPPQIQPLTPVAILNSSLLVPRPSLSFSPPPRKYKTNSIRLQLQASQALPQPHLPKIPFPTPSPQTGVPSLYSLIPRP